MENTSVHKVAVLMDYTAVNKMAVLMKHTALHKMTVLMEHTAVRKMIVLHLFMYQRVTLSCYPCLSIAFIFLYTLGISSSYYETEIHQALQDYKGFDKTTHQLLHTNTVMFS